MVKRTKANSGFTLMEVVIAVMILSTALVTLLGLQSSILRRALRDEEKQQAMLLARSILSAIEIKNQDIETQEITVPIEDLLEQLKIDHRTEEDREKVKKFEFIANLKVSDVSIKDVGDNLLKSVTLKIYTKEAELLDGQVLDAFKVVYLIPQESILP